MLGKNIMLSTNYTRIQKLKIDNLVESFCILLYYKFKITDAFNATLNKTFTEASNKRNTKKYNR